MGTGKDGRITKADAESAATLPTTTTQDFAEPKVLVKGDRADRREKISRLRRGVAQQWLMHNILGFTYNV